MSAADFLFAPDIQTLLKILLAAPSRRWTTAELAKKSKLEAELVRRALEHLVCSGMLDRRAGEGAGGDGSGEGDGDGGATVGIDTAFVFHDELRRIALKSFAAAEPIRAMLRSKFRHAVTRAFVLGEDREATVELLVVHGEAVPDEAEMASACRRLSTAMGRHLQVHVISGRRFEALTARDALGAKLAVGGAFEIIAPGDTKARPDTGREGLLRSARKRLAALVGP